MFESCRLITSEGFYKYLFRLHDYNFKCRIRISHFKTYSRFFIFLPGNSSPQRGQRLVSKPNSNRPFQYSPIMARFSRLWGSFSRDSSDFRPERMWRILEVVIFARSEYSFLRTPMPGLCRSRLGSEDRPGMLSGL